MQIQPASSAASVLHTVCSAPGPELLHDFSVVGSEDCSLQTMSYVRKCLLCFPLKLSPLSPVWRNFCLWHGSNVHIIWKRRLVRMEVSLKHTAMAFVLKRNDRRKGHKLIGSRVRARQCIRHCQSVCLPPSLHPSISPPPVLRLSLLLPATFLSSFPLISFHLERLFPLNAFLFVLDSG